MVAVNPVTNRVYVQATSGGRVGVVMLDGNTHAQLGFFASFPGQIVTNPLTNRLYDRSGIRPTLFLFADGTSGEIQARALVEGNVWDYAVHPGLARLYAAVATERNGWAKQLVVIQDEGSTVPTATPTPTRTPAPQPSFTPTDRLYLPALLRM
jgi:DNA-binding beta-propeller fold protein YncE